MLLAVLFVGVLTAYYFGLRAGAWAAAATLALCLVGLFVPRFALPIQVVLAVGVVAIWRIGSKRPRPPDAVLAVRYVRGLAGRAWAKLRKDRDR